MPLEDDRNYYIGGNLVVVRDTVTQERYEVYLHRVPGRDGAESILAHVEALGPNQLIGRVDARLNLNHSIWRVWVHQVVTPRFSAMRQPIIESVGNISMLDHSGALACDMVEAYRVHVLGQAPETMLPVTRVSRYEREPVI